MSLSQEQLNLIAEWDMLKKESAALVEREKELRKKCCDLFEDKSKGTKNLELANGYKLKAVFKHNITLKSLNDEIDTVTAVSTVLDKIEATGAAGVLIAERLVKWKPELSLTEYNQLPDNFKQLIDTVIVTTEATPTLELVEPKNK